MYRYLLTFTHRTNGGTDMTAIDFPTARPISSAADLPAITLLLRSEGYTEPFIIAFSLFTPAPTQAAQ
ncbi:hypothetical protein KBX53_00815 [Micromonospora sp. M51]|uniref:hypothetical protein n=1 Tax=Micromonospora TaxID=1873 RepID=UPI001B363968|nr:hypothetical protein [Micromonospora sp. M51]MBQ1009521.1 hypothetical protein [Micromonospora sp. M51]